MSGHINQDMIGRKEQCKIIFEIQDKLGLSKIFEFILTYVEQTEMTKYQAAFLATNLKSWHRHSSPH